jgi:LmbE family N-acetylglucosaminyl deacetylase
MGPKPYANLRRLESTRALNRLAIGDQQTTWWEHSELSLYAEFGEMSDDVAGDRPIFPEFEEIAAEIQSVVDDFRPDAVWTMAWQGGNPEHDLTHAAVVRAVRSAAVTERREIPVFELPAYELFVVAMRFRPWVRRDKHRIYLTDAELAAKTDMLEMYPSQERVISELRRAAVVAGKLGRLIGRGFTLEEFAAVEEFAQVPTDRDYTRSTHLSARFDYPGDDWQGKPIVFGRTLARVGSAWLKQRPS